MFKRIIIKIAILPIRLYQIIIRPLLPQGQCVFEPSCSTYAIQAIEKHGPIKGSYLAIRRILRCHPWQKQHYDPVP